MKGWVIGRFRGWMNDWGKRLIERFAERLVSMWDKRMEDRVG